MRLLVIVIVLLFLTACADKVRKPNYSAVDTTDVIVLALQTVLNGPFPEMDGIKRKSAFSDSIFLTTNLFSLEHLPYRVDSFRFKVLPDSMICFAIRTDTLNTELPNYLNLQSFEKTDSGYLVRFESMDCIPSPSRDGAVSLHIVSTKDKFVFNHR